MKPITTAIVALLVIVSGLGGYVFGMSGESMNADQVQAIVAIMNQDEMMKMMRDGSFRILTDEYAKGVKDAGVEELLMQKGVSEKALMLYRDMPGMMERQMKQLDDAIMMK